MNARRMSALVAHLIALALLAAVLAAPAPAQDTGRAGGVELVEMTVGDLDRAAQFYCEVLEFQIVNESQEQSHHFVDLRLGDETLRLSSFPGSPGRAMPADSRANDHWFQHVAIIVSDMNAAYQRLRKYRVRHASSGPQTLPEWNAAAAGIRAFYFRDPDGHFLEVLQFPAGKGNPKWQRSGGPLFLGIDHTAIVVADTDRSLQFYRDQLGLVVAGESENHGTEQEHLNGVFGARLRITALRGANGPGIELLEYIFPTDGRSAPADVPFEDIQSWRIHLNADMPVTFAAGKLPSGAAAPPPSGTIRDPDGHALVLSSSERNP